MRKIGKTELFESKLSDVRWTIYAVVADLGWIGYGIGLVWAIVGGSLRGGALAWLSVLAVLFAAGIACGLWELISEHRQGLGRILPWFRLCRGFGLLAISDLAGAIVGAAGYGLASGGAPWALMAAGGLLCGVFSLLLFARYKRI